MCTHHQVDVTGVQDLALEHRRMENNSQVLASGLDSKFCENLEGLRRSRAHGGLWHFRIVLVSFLLL